MATRYSRPSSGTALSYSLKSSAVARNRRAMYKEGDLDAMDVPAFASVNEGNLFFDLRPRGRPEDLYARTEGYVPVEGDYVHRRERDAQGKHPAYRWNRMPVPTSRKDGRPVITAGVAKQRPHSGLGSVVDSSLAPRRTHRHWRTDRPCAGEVWFGLPGRQPVGSGAWHASLPPAGVVHRPARRGMSARGNSDEHAHLCPGPDPASAATTYGDYRDHLGRTPSGAEGAGLSRQTHFAGTPCPKRAGSTPMQAHHSHHTASAAPIRVVRPRRLRSRAAAEHASAFPSDARHRAAVRHATDPYRYLPDRSGSSYSRGVSGDGRERRRLDPRNAYRDHYPQRNWARRVKRAAMHDPARAKAGDVAVPSQMLRMADTGAFSLPQWPPRALITRCERVQNDAHYPERFDELTVSNSPLDTLFTKRRQSSGLERKKDWVNGSGVGLLSRNYKHRGPAKNAAHSVRQDAPALPADHLLATAGGGWDPASPFRAGHHSRSSLAGHAPRQDPRREKSRFEEGFDAHMARARSGAVEVANSSRVRREARGRGAAGMSVEEIMTAAQGLPQGSPQDLPEGGSGGGPAVDPAIDPAASTYGDGRARSRAEGVAVARASLTERLSASWKKYSLDMSTWRTRGGEGRDESRPSPVRRFVAVCTSGSNAAFTAMLILFVAGALLALRFTLSKNCGGKAGARGKRSAAHLPYRRVPAAPATFVRGALSHPHY